MSNFNPEKLTVEFRNGINAYGPIMPRLYTLTHSDLTGDLFLTIGSFYAWDKVNSMRDEVLVEWTLCNNSLYFCVFVYVDQGEHDLHVSKKRKEIFKRELPLALEAIRYGDRLLFNRYPELNQAQIIVNFISSYPSIANQENWSTFN